MPAYRRSSSSQVRGSTGARASTSRNSSPPSGSSTHARSASTASGRSTCSGTQRASAAVSGPSKALVGGFALNQTAPRPATGTRTSTDHGRSRTLNSPPARSPWEASRSLTHSRAEARHASCSHGVGAYW